MRTFRSDRRIVIGLIAALIFEIAVLFWHLGILSFGGGSGFAGEQLAGEVARSVNELRRRSLNSLVWEKSAESEPVFYYDSVLTLNQSTATLKLSGGIDVELSENTLVTIEPLSGHENAEIRLKFERGSMQARNPYHSAKIEGDGFQVDLQAGSDMQLRQTGEQEFEVQLTKGAGQVVNTEGTVALSQDGLLRLNKGKSQVLAMDHDLKWQAKPPKRIYTHEEGVDLKLSWQGMAGELKLQTLGEKEKTVLLKDNQSELPVHLNPGHHLAYLRSGNKTSEPVELEVWRAPTLHLIMPLPRNRLRTSENNQFLWTRVPEAQSYELRLQTKEGDERVERTPANSVPVQFTEEYDGQWGVWIKDKQGYLIPPLYKYPVYIRHRPFEAPKLNSPKLRKPATKGSSLWQWMLEAALPIAHADEDKWEAFFSWEKVEGADRYQIEISESADFRQTAVSIELRKPEFLWSEFRPGRTFYWRVAAGSSLGRMGVFTEPSLVADTAEVRKVPVLVKEAPSESPPAQKPYEAAPPPKPSAPALLTHEPRGWRLLAKPGGSVLDARSNEQVHATMGGLKLLSFAIERDVKVTEEIWWNLEAKYARSTYKPRPKTTYPFQKDLNVQSAEVSATGMRTDSNLGIGFKLGQSPKIERSGTESVRSSDQSVFGMHGRGRWRMDALEYQGDVGVLGGSGLYGGYTNQRVIYAFARDYGFAGAGLEAAYLARGSRQTIEANGFLIFGIHFEP